MGKAMTVAEIQELVPKLAVTVEPVGRLQEYAGNAKEHTAEQVQQIKSSMRQVGFCDPIGVWTNAEGKSEVVEGHGRLMAALELGLQSVPVIHLDGLSDEQRRFYALVHNKLTMNTGWTSTSLMRSWMACRSTSIWRASDSILETTAGTAPRSQQKDARRTPSTMSSRRSSSQS